MSNQEQIKHYLRLAMDEAEQAAASGDHPYGAVIVGSDGTVVATGRNGVNTDHDPSSHAEMNAIRAACASLGNASLAGLRLYTNGAPCTMCATVILASGVDEAWYSAPTPLGRTTPTLEELVLRSASTLRVNQGVLAQEASAQLARLERR